MPGQGRPLTSSLHSSRELPSSRAGRTRPESRESREWGPGYQKEKRMFRRWLPRSTHVGWRALCILSQTSTALRSLWLSKSLRGKGDGTDSPPTASPAQSEAFSQMFPCLVPTTMQGRHLHSHFTDKDTQPTKMRWLPTVTPMAKGWGRNLTAKAFSTLASLKEDLNLYSPSSTKLWSSLGTEVWNKVRLRPNSGMQ